MSLVAGTYTKPRRNVAHDEKGRFKRLRFTWTFDNWDDGGVDGDGRFSVYRPDYPRAGNDGYACRAHVVFWLVTGIVPNHDQVIHHKNENKSDDGFENLELMDFGAHSTLHNRAAPTFKLCPKCNKEFLVPTDHPNKKFCSAACYHATPSKRRRSKIVVCNECRIEFQVIPSKKRYFCSPRCAALWNWRSRR